MVHKSNPKLPQLNDVCHTFYFTYRRFVKVKSFDWACNYITVFIFIKYI